MSFVCTKNLGGTDVDIHAGAHGHWTIYLKGTTDGASLGHGPQLEGAEDEARRKIAKGKVKVNVPFYNIDGRHGIAHSIHAGNGDALVRYDGGEADRVGYGSRELVKGDTPEEVRLRIVRIDEDTSALNRERKDLMDRWSIDLRKAVNEAIAAAESGDAA